MSRDHAALGDRLDKALGAGKAQRQDEGEAPFIRIADDVAGLKRGQVAFMGRGEPRLLPDFPSIARVLALDAGVRAHLRGPFRVEEKIDGFNVRIAKWRGETMAFTRGGWPCPFTIDRLPDMAELDGLFEEEPDAVICAEVAGPGNPYMRAQARAYSDDVALFAFDLARLNRDEPEPLARRDALFARHGVPRAPQLLQMSGYGRDAGERLRALALDLDARRAEGMILKPESGVRRLKYVTPYVNLSDIAADAGLMGELPGGFFTSRLLRLVMSARELGAGHRLREAEGELGRLLVSGLEDTLEQMEEEGRVYQDVTIRVRDPQTVDRLTAHLNRSSRTVKCHVQSRAREGLYTRAVIRKVMLRSTSYLQGLLGGDPIVD